MFYAIANIKKYCIKAICACIPNKHTRKSVRLYLQSKLNPPIQITIDEVDSYVPKAVLAKMRATNNEDFIDTSRSSFNPIGGGAA